MHVISLSLSLSLCLRLCLSVSVSLTLSLSLSLTLSLSLSLTLSLSLSLSLSLCLAVSLSLPPPSPSPSLILSPFILFHFPSPQGDESHKADEYIRYVKEKLPDAVKQCVMAASEEFEPKIQQALLMVSECKYCTIVYCMFVSYCTVVIA